MSFTLVNSAATSNNGSGSSLGVALSGTPVSAGDLVVVTASCGGAGIGIDSVSDGTTTFSTLTQLTSGNNGARIRGFYLLASVATGLPTYTVTFSANCTSRSITVYIFTPTAAVTFDQQNGTEVIASTNGVSGNVTTTGTDEMVLASQMNENQSASSSEQINSLAATGSINSGTNHTLWYLAFASTFTGQATETIGSSTRILTIIAGFKIAVAAKPTGPFPTSRPDLP